MPIYSLSMAALRLPSQSWVVTTKTTACKAQKICVLSGSFIQNVCCSQFCTIKGKHLTRVFQLPRDVILAYFSNRDSCHPHNCSPPTIHPLQWTLGSLKWKTTSNSTPLQVLFFLTTLPEKFFFILRDRSAPPLLRDALWHPLPLCLIN